METTSSATDLAMVHISLTTRQRQLIELIQRRNRYHLPTVQRDLAEMLGIRRDSLNKLLARTRQVLRGAGVELVMPQRSRDSYVAMVSLSDMGGDA